VKEQGQEVGEGCDPDKAFTSTRSGRVVL
jgi:hypothetical protein